MSSEPTKARTARQAKRRRAKAAHGKRRAAAPPAQDNPGLVPVPPERFPTERRGAVIAALWRLAEEQTRALEGPRGAPLGSSELKALVDVLERLSRLEERAAARDPLVGEDGIRPFSFIESSQLIEEIAQRYEEFARSEPLDVPQARALIQDLGPNHREDGDHAPLTGCHRHDEFRA